MFNFASWGWGRWLLVLFGALVLVTYLGLLSFDGVEEALEWLESKSGAGGVFKQPGSVRGEGFFVILSFLLLMPLAAMTLLFVALFVLVVLSGTLAPIGRLLGVPNWALMALVAIGLAGLAYAESAAWWPWALWVVGVVASAVLSVLR